MEYILSEIKKDNTRDQNKMVALLNQEGILKDSIIDYSIGLFDDDYNLVATGSSYKNTLRCMAVDNNHQGEGLLNQVVTALIEHESSIGNQDLFLYTKVNSSKFFADLGFYEIARIPDKLVFMENKKEGFNSYLASLALYKNVGINGAIVMNANPFTKGHKYLVKEALKQVDNLYIFVVSCDESEFSFDERFRRVKEGTKDLPNITIIPSGDYIISEATFPSYFLKDKNVVSTTHGELDAHIFCKIAERLNITKRFVGTEPISKLTNNYNNSLKNILPVNGVELIETPRLTIEGNIVSASLVRKAYKENDNELLKLLLP